MNPPLSYQPNKLERLEQVVSRILSRQLGLMNQTPALAVVVIYLSDLPAP